MPRISDSTFAGRGTVAADAAIRDARAGRIAVPEMLRILLEAQVFVPLAHEPVIEANVIAKWQPATVAKPTAGGAYLVAFTDAALAHQFATANAEYGHGLLVDATWLLSALPANHGIAFNLGGGSAFEWSASGIAEYLSRAGAPPNVA
jgi:hypothetical protein